MIPTWERRLVALATAAGLAGALPAAGAEPVLELVHAEANVGGASGGHTALRVGDAVHHFQAASDDLLVLERDHWQDFRFRYNVLQNRPLLFASIPATSAELRGIADGFARVRLAQGRLFAARDDAERDAALLEALAGDRPGVRIRGAGLLDPERSGSEAGRALRARVAEAQGAGFLGEEQARLDAELADPDRARSDPRGYREALAARAAVAALAGAHAPGPDVLVTLEDAPQLAPEERVAFERRRVELGEAVSVLLRSPRPDRGTALFVATARYHAVARSLADDRLWTLDPFPDEGPRLEGRALRKRRDELKVVAEIAARRVAAARQAFAEQPSARRHARLEELAARAREYAGGAEGRAVREGDRALVPSRGRVLPLPLAIVPAESVSEPLARAGERAREAQQQLRDAWSYDLFTSNCVTELALTWAAAAGPETPVRIDASDVGFVPFVFFERVASQLPSERVTRTPSFRRRSLVELREQDAALPVALRESNVWTARLYRRRDADGSFLLFSDGGAALRPLAGILNLGYATLDGALGVLTAPFDRGERLVSAGKGIFFSLPELVFVNIRKGSFDAAGLRRARSVVAEP